MLLLLPPVPPFDTLHALEDGAVLEEPSSERTRLAIAHCAVDSRSSLPFRHHRESDHPLSGGGARLFFVGMFTAAIASVPSSSSQVKSNLT